MGISTYRDTRFSQSPRNLCERKVDSVFVDCRTWSFKSRHSLLQGERDQRVQLLRELNEATKQKKELERLVQKQPAGNRAELEREHDLLAR